MFNKKLLLSKMIMEDKTKSDLAKYLNLSINTLSNKINGYSDFKVIEIKKIMTFLNLSTEEIKEIFLS